MKGQLCSKIQHIPPKLGSKLKTKFEERKGHVMKFMNPASQSGDGG